MKLSSNDILTLSTTVILSIDRCRRAVSTRRFCSRAHLRASREPRYGSGKSITVELSIGIADSHPGDGRLHGETGVRRGGGD